MDEGKYENFASKCGWICLSICGVAFTTMLVTAAIKIVQEAFGEGPL